MGLGTRRSLFIAAELIIDEGVKAISIRRIVGDLCRFSIANIARAVREGMEFEGAHLKAGEQILMAGGVHGLEEGSFACPFDADFTRRDAHKHSASSDGIHRRVDDADATLTQC